MAVHADFGFGGIDGCPACGSGQLVAAPDGGPANFLCVECRQCWHLSMGWAQRVDPQFCGTCVERGRCLAASGVIDLTRESFPSGSRSSVA